MEQDRLERVKSMMGEFKNFMRGKVIDQGIGETNKLTDKECGCCMGAHLARFFVESPGYTNFHIREQFFDEEAMERRWPYMDEYAGEYLDWVRKEYPSNDNVNIDDDQLLTVSGLIEEWLEVKQEEQELDENLLCYLFGDGIYGLYNSLDVPNTRVFSLILNAQLFGENGLTGGFNAWGPYQWCIAHKGDTEADALHAAIAAYDLYMEEHHNYMATPEQDLEDTYTFCRKLLNGDLTPDLRKYMDIHGVTYSHPHFQ